MPYSRVRAGAVALSLIAAAGCAKSPAQPTAAGGTTVSPVPVLPGNNAAVKNADQPIALVVTNAVSAGTGVTYTFQVATDVAFASIAQTKDAVPEGTGGQTTVRLDALAAGRDYYWRARATAGGVAGAFGVASRFALGSAISLNAPVPISPLTNSQTSQRPALRVTNAVRSGATGAITYTFEIASTSAFTAGIANATVAEGVNETGFIPTADLPVGPLLFWRATAVDAANATSSVASSVQSFTVTVTLSQAGLIAQQRGVVLWPGVQPPGTVGRATLGPGWEVRTIRDVLGQLVPSPTLEELRVFDLLDRGLDPDAAIAWMNSNGYFTAALYYPSVLSIGFQSHYMTYLFGAWELVTRTGA
jgi:hypothetical protein